MNRLPSARSVAAATHAVALLDAQAADLRAELIKLRKQVVDVESVLGDVRASHLQEANQQLVLAVLQADQLAEEAVADLAAVTSAHQRDALTGLPNRLLGLDRLESAIVMARRSGKRLAVLFFDLDHFKAVNDHWGHTSGDQVLQLVAQRLKSVLRDSDTVSRYGGDEFLVLLPEVSDPSDAGEIARELLAALSVPGVVRGRMLHPSASLGISLYPDDGEDAATLINRADAAMYRCKRRGSGGFDFYTGQDLDPDRYHLLPGSTPPSSTLNDDVPTSSEPRQNDLRDANEQLLMSALVAREGEAKATTAHRQQLKFMAMVAHELRAPLTPLSLATGMLNQCSATDEIPIDLVAMISSQVARMARLVDDLLDGSRLSTARLRIEFGSVELAGLLDQVAMAIQPLMQERQQHFSALLLPGPVNVRGDPIRLAQVFNNLLDNARKYTPEGGDIALGMSVTKDLISISVRDNGVGIAPDMLPNIFELFVQDAHTLAHSSGGLGVGLAVVRDLVQAHGGNVAARSAGRDQGSEFVVTLPLA